jgi:hypothetical protein
MSLVLVLNADYTPLNTTSWSRGFILVNQGKAEIIKSDKTPILSPYQNYLKPLIIRLFKYIKYYRSNIKVNRNKIFKRDNYKCVYCESRKDLTLDHVIPKSRGGGNNWDNLVTSCSKCNIKKANRTPEEARMKMSHKPYTPTIIDENKSVKLVWDEYQDSFNM